jgi:hypothetical protein
VLSEDEQERRRHDSLVRQILNSPGRAIPLRRLFSLTQYPRDVMVLYAEGFSVSNFLVGQSSRQEFLNFVADGMRQGWDRAVQAHYRYRSVEELEQAWVSHLGDSRGAPAALASAAGAGRTSAPPASRGVVRQTLPPAAPVLGAPRPAVVRGVSAEEGVTRPGDDRWATPSAAPPSEQPASAVRLGAPRPVPPAGSWSRPTGSAP